MNMSATPLTCYVKAKCSRPPKRLACVGDDSLPRTGRVAEDVIVYVHKTQRAANAIILRNGSHPRTTKSALRTQERMSKLSAGPSTGNIDKWQKRQMFHTASTQHTKVHSPKLKQAPITCGDAAVVAARRRPPPQRVANPNPQRTWYDALGGGSSPAPHRRDGRMSSRGRFGNSPAARICRADTAQPRGRRNPKTATPERESEAPTGHHLEAPHMPETHHEGTSAPWSGDFAPAPCECG